MVSHIIMGIIAFCIYFAIWVIISIRYIIKNKMNIVDNNDAFKRITMTLILVLLALVIIIFGLIKILSLLGGTLL